ncbi:hypothetical protein CBR_g32353 [Chara braunii]|uniref:Reverse transcriptase RNase H-like domain-containing protein n=1 Tax=Chara braunii TaxID=69332 RepID=A0A388JYI2_CHABU|nr:hypothetical protein CBR_g32353 [Chara braunii]|eukprot:GBG62763.1 hypothetical protein CBR_g32353 [Chara braunii]
MLQMVKRYCMVKYKEEVSELVHASRDWPDFKAKLLDKYQLEDQLLDLADLRKVSRRKFGTAKQFLTEFKRVARLVPDLPDKDPCLIFLENFSEVEQRELMKDMTGRYDWPKIKENLLAGSFDQMLYRLLTQQKEDREKEGVSVDKDQAVYKTLTNMRNMMADMKEERLKLQLMMVQTKGGKRKGKAPVVEEVSNSSSEEEDEEEVEPRRKLTKAERKALNEIRGGQGTRNLIDPNVEGGIRKEAFRRMGRDLPTTFRLASPEEVEQIELEAAMESVMIEDAKVADERLSKEQEEILQRAQTVVRKMTRCREAFVQVCADMNEEWPGLPQVFLFVGWDRDGQGGLTDVTASQPGSSSAGRLMATTVLSRLAFKRPATAGLPQARRARRPPRPRAASEEGSSQPRESETIAIEEDDGEEDELLWAEDERQAKQRAMERGPETGKADVEEGELKKKKQVYTIPVEQGLDIEQIVDRILESQCDLFTLKEFLAASPKIREDFRHRLFAARVEHLRKLVRKNQEWEWGPKQQAAVDVIKAQFREGGLILGVLCFDNDPNRLFVIETDAGPTALGGVLIQKDGEGRERPLRFESRTLNEAERKYSQFKKEALAVLHCFKIFRNYVFGRRIVLRVDPTALAQSLKNYYPSDPTIARWLIYIWMFDFEIERIAGTQNRADGLSRIEWDSSKDRAEDSVPMDGFLETDEQQLSINVWEYINNASSRPGKSIWSSPSCYQKRSELVMRESFIEEDPWGERSAEQMMRLVLSDPVQLSKEPLTIEGGHEQGDEVLRISGGMVFLVNSLIQEDHGKLMLEEGEGSEIKEVFREKEYDGIYKKIGLWLNGDLNEAEIEPEIREKAKDFVIRQGHLFKKSDDGMPKRVVWGVPRQLDVLAALHDGVAGGHRST